MNWARSPLLLGLLQVPALCMAQTPEPQNPDQWLARIAQAGASLQYQGTFVYSHDGRIEAMRVTRTLGPKGPREEIISLNGDRRTMVRENGNVHFTAPDTGTTEVGHGDLPLMTLQPAQLQKATEFYGLRLTGADRVAGLDARVLEARPGDNSRYGYRLWVEPRSGMVLGSALDTAEGAPVEQLMFTTVNLLPSPAASRAPLAIVPPSQTGSAAAPASWRMGWLPPGFRLIAAPSATTQGRSHLLFSDGLAYVSVYIEPISATTRPIDGLVRRGAINLYARPIADSQVVVIGDVPGATAEHIARGIEPAPTQH